jgi:hypothetical protein
MKYILMGCAIIVGAVGIGNAGSAEIPRAVFAEKFGYAS